MKKQTLLILMAFAASVFFCAAACAAGQKVLRINCTIHSPYEAFFFRLVEEICARNDIAVERNTPPVGRSLIHVNQGIDDGDGPRIGGLAAAYPNLIPVPEPFGEFNFGAFATSDEIMINGWSDLKELNVAYIIGWKIFDHHVTAAKSITKVRNKDLLFGHLNAGRTDVALITKLAGYAEIRKLGFENMRFIEPPLAVKPNYLYLHKRHEALAAKLARTLKAIKQEGTYSRLSEEMLSPYLPE